MCALSIRQVSIADVAAALKIVMGRKKGPSRIAKEDVEKQLERERKVQCVYVCYC
jgi:hypothetical protein